MEILPPLSVFCQLGFAKREDYYGAGSAMFPMPQAARKMEENLTKCPTHLLRSARKIKEIKEKRLGAN